MMSDDQVKQWKATKVIGIIGLGDMGLLYATKFAEAGWKVVCCDREELYEELKLKHANAKFELVLNGHYVSRVSDYTIYSVEAENIDKIVGMYGASTKLGSIVGGQTSCKYAEIAAFEKHIPSDVSIVTVHSLHGPKVNTEDQPLVIIRHRCPSDTGFEFVQSILSCFKSKIVYLTCEEHDRITADTQAVTHAAFLSMGAAWARLKIYPWVLDNGNDKWYGSLENVKMNISLRIYSNKWHVYAGLAITNPSAHHQILQYATSCTELFTIFLRRDEVELTERLRKAKEFVFSKHKGFLLLDDKLLDKYSLFSNRDSSVPIQAVPNSHLSLLAIVDSWYKLGINPYDHMICSTPLFRVFLGVTEYLFLTPGLLEQTIKAAAHDESFRKDDLEFVISAREWSSIISFSNFDLYRRQFEEIQKFFQPMFPEANRIGNEMLKTIARYSPNKN